MAAALACSKILKELAKEEEDTDTTEDMMALAEEYERKAIGEQEGTSNPELLSHPAGRAGWLCPGGVWGEGCLWSVIPNRDPLIKVGMVELRGLCLSGGGSTEGATVWC